MATPTADISSFTPEQQKLFLAAAQQGSGVATTLNGVTTTVSQANPITLEDLTGSSSPANVPPPPPSIPYDTSNLDALISKYQSPTTEQKTASANQASVLQSLKDLITQQGTETAKRAQLETSAGIPDLSKQLNELVGQIRQNNVGAFSATQQQEDRLAPAFAITGSQAQIERQRSVRNYGLAAAAEAIQGNIALAQDNIQRAIDAEFKPLESQIEYQKLLLTENRAEIERADKNAADRLTLVLNERERLLANQKTEREGILNIMTTAVGYGAPTSIVDSLRNAKSIDEAISIATPYLQDPKAKIELQNAILDTQLKKADIAYKQRQTALLGVPTPEDLKKSKEELANAKSSLQATQDKALLIDAALSGGGIKGTVGTFETGSLPWGLNIIADLTGFGRNRLSYRTLTGEQQSYIGTIKKITNGLTLDELINAKARGATFGALSEGELNTLASAATQLGTWEIKDGNGQTIGWNVDENSFKRELETIKNLTNRALILKQQSIFSPDELDILNSLEKGITSPLDYYQ